MLEVMLTDSSNVVRAHQASVNPSAALHTPTHSHRGISKSCCLARGNAG